MVMQFFLTKTLFQWLFLGVMYFSQHFRVLIYRGMGTSHQKSVTFTVPCIFLVTHLDRSFSSQLKVRFQREEGQIYYVL